MPWSCTSCGTAVARDDVSECPTCKTAKQSWTMIEDQTRAMVVARKAFALLAGDLDEPVTPDDPRLATVALAPATHAVAVPKAEVLQLAADGLLAAPADVLHVELRRGATRDLTVRLEVLYAGQPSQELELPRQHAGEPDPVVVQLLLVYGDEGLDGLEALGEARLVDIGEDLEPGYAPAIEVSALGRPAQTLPVQGAPEFSFSV